MIYQCEIIRAQWMILERCLGILCDQRWYWSVENDKYTYPLCKGEKTWTLTIWPTQDKGETHADTRSDLARWLSRVMEKYRMSAFVYGIDMFTYCQIKGVHVCKGILILSSFTKHKDPPYLRHSLDLYQISIPLLFSYRTASSSLILPGHALWAITEEEKKRKIWELRNPAIRSRTDVDKAELGHIKGETASLYLALKSLHGNKKSFFN